MNSREKLLAGQRIGVTPTLTNAERQRQIRNQIEQERVAAEARERLSSLPPGSLETEPAPMLTGKPGSG